MLAPQSLLSLLALVRQSLPAHYEEREANAIARLYVEKTQAVSQTDIYADKPLQLLPEQLDLLAVDLKQLSEGTPVQYVLGEAHFDNHRFVVSPAVLIPRPETEGLVQLGAESVEAISNPRILDAGTGSGCIAISLALRLPSAQVTAWDISSSALQIAQTNAQQLNAAVRFKEKDLLTCAHETPSTTPPFDLIVSNPPYIRQREASMLEPQVLEHEPHLALFVPDYDPLQFYRALGLLGQSYLRSGGVLCVETHRDYNRQTADLFEVLGYVEVTTSKDCFSQPRFVRAVAP